TRACGLAMECVHELCRVLSLAAGRVHRRTRAASGAAVGHLTLSPSRKAMDSNSTRTASSIGITGRTSKTNAGNIEQNLWTRVGSSQSSIIYPPQSPTRMTNNSILKLAGAFHWVKTSRIRFWALWYSIGDHCGRSVQVSMYFLGVLLRRVGCV